MRVPMGLNASKNEWCAKSDAMMEGCPWTIKTVDDTIIWAEDRQQLDRRIGQVLENCRRLNITISKKKFEIREEIEFAGHINSKNGISPNKSKYDAISKFQTPKNIKELRSFLGLAQQLGAIISNLAHLTAKIRPLLKKGTAFLWLEEHEEAVIQAKQTLVEKTTVVPFDPTRKTIVLTDASRLYGIGYAVVQEAGDGKLHSIECGSRPLTPTQQNYATIEIECLAVQWALLRSKFYLHGLQSFEVWTDHKPLQGIFAKELHKLEKPLLMRMREKIAHFNFELKWVAGKTHYIADALSRVPVFRPKEQLKETEEEAICLKIADDPIINLIASAAGDIEYQRIISVLQSAASPADLEDNQPAQHFRKKWHKLSIVQLENEEHPLIIRNGKQIVIPRTARKDLLRELHRSHSGIAKTYLKAKELFYWPSMKSDIMNLVAACSACTEDLPAQPRQKLNENKKPAPPTNDGPACRDDLHKKQIQARDQQAASHLPLQPGDTALLADGITGKWTKECCVFFPDLYDMKKRARFMKGLLRRHLPILSKNTY